MSDNLKDISITYDNDANPSRVTIELNLDAFAENEAIGTATLRGLMDEFKGLLISHVIKKRSNRSKILTPGGNGGNLHMA